MTDYLTFDATVEPLEWGKSVYTILRLPDWVAEDLTNCKAKRVEGEINEYPVNLALTKAPPVSGLFLYTGKDLMTKANITPGDRFEVRLRPADPNRVDLPTDVQNALRSSGKTEIWNTLPPGKRRGLLHTIATAKRPETRAKRVGALMAQLS